MKGTQRKKISSGSKEQHLILIFKFPPLIVIFAIYLKTLNEFILPE